MFLKHSPLFLIIRKILFLVLIYFFIRVLFLAFNYDLFSNLDLKNVPYYFVIGLRFDLMTLTIINSLWMILLFLPHKLLKNKIINLTISFYFVLINFIAIVINLTDVVFFRFNMKRITTDIFSLLDVVPNLIGSFVIDFWYIFLVAFGLLYLLTKLSKINLENVTIKNYIVSFCLFIFIFPLGFRGGWQRKPLRPLTAAEFVNINHSPIVLNSAFTFIKSLTKRELEPKKYLSVNEATQQFNPIWPPFAEVSRKKNIIVIILESFSQEFIHTYNHEHNATPFLDELIKRSTTFKNAFANGRRSSEALVSILSGIPNLMDDPYLHSNYADTQFIGLANNLQQINYKTYFFNGSQKSTLGWSDFILASGFNEHISRETYNNDLHYDGHWGIYDDYMLSYFADYKFQEPFLGVFFSLSSHHPYHVRSELPFKKFKNEFINSVSYTDYALSLFFENIKQKPWFKNSIFIITADHSPGAHSIKPEKMKSNPFKNKVGMYKVPLIVFDPGNETPKVYDHAVQHVDLMPSILKIVGFNQPFYSFGKDIFNEQESHAYQYANGVYQILSNEHVLFFDGEKSISMYNYQNDLNLMNNILKDPNTATTQNQLELKLKSIIQRFNHDLINNTLSVGHPNN